MSLRAQTDQRLQLAITQELRQSLQILAMNALELSAFLETVLAENPLLELEEEPQEEASLESAEAEQAALESGDERWDWVRSSFAEEEGNREALWRDEPTLLARLHEQIDRQPMDERARAIAHAIVDSLDEDGYFRADPREVGEAVAASPEEVERVLEEVVHHLEPAGVGARDLTECLLLQLDGRNPMDALCRRILMHCPEALAESDAVLAEAAHCSAQEAAQARARLRRLDPWPGHGLRGTPGLYVRPELIFRRTNTGEIEVELADAEWQRLRMNERWARARWEGEDAAFVRRARQEAKFLLKALAQRAQTMLAVGRCLARRQRLFLEIGVLGLRPLTLQEVAEELGIHESTVSRVTSGKYALTPVGVVELKRFFSGGLPTRGGGAVSVHRVKQRIRMLIESEPPGRPISDQAIAERLQMEGIQIARRTVAKYREQMGIPSTSVRRRRAREHASRR